MRGKLLFVGGVAVGYLLGAKAGRQRYEQIVAKSRQVWESPTVQEAAGVVQAQATKLYDQGKQVVNDKLHTAKNGRSPALVGDTADEEGAWDTASRRAGFTANAF